LGAQKGPDMLLDYINAAMGKARYEILPDGEGFYGEIPGFQGVWANAPTLEECRRQLQSALEDWLLFSIERHDPLPVVGGIELLPPKSRQEVA
jgi:predicted RNase H-like HicB family nuclease